MTKAANLRARLHPDGLPRGELPAVIRDAISVTERLGFRYIWIDALCIIQDDTDDKQLELGKMSQYYRNSFLTIAASTPSVTMGFVGKVGRCHKHPDSPLPRDLVPFVVFSHTHEVRNKGIPGVIYVREENPYQLHEEPLNRRAWTLQECVLAPRVLLFGSRVMWFCQHMTHSDGGIEDWSFDQNDQEGTRRELQIELRKLERYGLRDEVELGSSRPTERSLYRYDLWHRLVAIYSQRDLSVSDDKLPAISAIAAEFSKLVKDEYIAGLWRSNLARDLLWTTPKPSTQHPEKWRAPSWSWASVDDIISYDRPPPEGAILLANMLEAKALPKTDIVPFGEIESGSSLTITAPSLPDFDIDDEEMREKFSKTWLDAFTLSMGENERAMLHYILKQPQFSRGKVKKEGSGKVKEEEPEEKEFRLPDGYLPVFIYGEPDEPVRLGMEQDTTTPVLWRVWGLILKKVVDGSAEQTYERVISFSQLSMNVSNDFVLTDGCHRTFRVV
jgi:hypothetical protein